MASTLEKLEKSQVNAQVEIPAEKFSEAVKTAYLKERKKFNIQGFRKGSAPKKMIENFYGKDIFYEGAVEELWRDALKEIIDEHKLDVLGQPVLNMSDVEEGKPLTLTFTLSVYPEVKLGEYKGVELEEIKTIITKEDLDEMLDRERETRARYSVVDRPVAEGDRLTLDYKGKVDDEYFDGGAAEEASLDIGSGQFIPGFEEALIGLEAGEHREISVTFPDEYNSEQLAGKKAVFEIYIHEIREKELPDLDDDLAKDASEFDTLDEWKADIEAKLKQDAEKQDKQQMKNAVVAAVAANAEIDIPDVLVENQMDSLLNDFAQRLAYQGMNLDVYCKYVDSTQQQVREGFREEAQARVRNQLVVDEIAKVEGIKASDEQVQERLEKLAESYGQKDNLEEFKKNLGAESIGYVGEELVIENTVDFLVDNAKLVEPKKKADEENEDTDKLENSDE